MVSHRDLRHLKSGVRIVPIVSIASKNLRAIGMIETIRAIMLKSLNRPKRAVLQVKGRRAGLGLAAVYLKGTKKYCQENERTNSWECSKLTIQKLMLFYLFRKKKQVLNSEDFSLDGILKRKHCEIWEKLLYSGRVLDHLDRPDRPDRKAGDLDYRDSPDRPDHPSCFGAFLHDRPDRLNTF